jgi:hypothetical protein
VTTYFVAGPATLAKASELPVSEEASVPMITYDVAEVGPVVNDTVAAPFASVVEVGDANDPPVPVFDHVTVRPAVGTGLPFTSVS